VECTLHPCLDPAWSAFGCILRHARCAGFGGRTQIADKKIAKSHGSALQRARPRASSFVEYRQICNSSRSLPEITRSKSFSWRLSCFSSWKIDDGCAAFPRVQPHRKDGVSLVLPARHLVQALLGWWPVLRCHFRHAGPFKPPQATSMPIWSSSSLLALPDLSPTSRCVKVLSLATDCRSRYSGCTVGVP
jgi:hypothetical protein